MKNPHIIVGEPRRCLCGMYDGKAVSCLDILERRALVQDCDDVPAPSSSHFFCAQCSRGPLMSWEKREVGCAYCEHTTAP